jgi:hypothetical protein
LSGRAGSPSSWGRAPSRTRHSKTWHIRGGRSATRRRSRLSSSGSTSTAGSRSGSLRTAKKSCYASLKRATPGHHFPSLWASAPRKVHDRSTWSGFSWRRSGSPDSLCPPTTAPPRAPRLAGNVLHDGDGALADERDGDRVGADAVARDPAGGVGGAPPRTGGSRRQENFQSLR